VAGRYLKYAGFKANDGGSNGPKVQVFLAFLPGERIGSAAILNRFESILMCYAPRYLLNHSHSLVIPCLLWPIALLLPKELGTGSLGITTYYYS
jgi:hypothetical protein